MNLDQKKKKKKKEGTEILSSIYGNKKIRHPVYFLLLEHQDITGMKSSPSSGKEIP